MMKNSMISSRRIVAVSGGFDPLHIGHIHLIIEAKKLGDHLIVIVNNDDFLIRKKGYYFLSQSERSKIILNVKGVDEVFISHDKDDTVCKSLLSIRPHIFANGGDRKESNVEENIICKKIYCHQIFGVGGFNKENSSSLIIKNFLKRYLQGENVFGNG